MFNKMLCSSGTRTRLFAGAAVAALLIGLSGVGAQAADPQATTQEASLPSASTADTQPIPLGPENVREVQNQLIALGFDPGAADGQIGPATTSAAQQYDLSRGGDGHVSIDGAFLARLKADTAPRLTYDEVAARSRAAQSTRTTQPAYAGSSAASSSASGASQFGNVVQQIVPMIGAAIANSNANRSYGYGPGYYGNGPGYYGPPPGYGYGYGGF